MEAEVGRERNGNVVNNTHVWKAQNLSLKIIMRLNNLGRKNNIIKY